MSRKFWTLSALYFVALAAIVTDFALTSTLWIAWAGAAALVVLYVLILRTGRRDRAAREAKPAPVEPDPDPWAVIAANARELSTDELIAMHGDMTTYANAGTAVQFEKVIRAAIADELTAREIPLCPCGAPLPGGVHTLTCQES